jgi:hypothetical protein
MNPEELDIKTQKFSMGPGCPGVTLTGGVCRACHPHQLWFGCRPEIRKVVNEDLNKRN